MTEHSNHKQNMPRENICPHCGARQSLPNDRDFKIKAGAHSNNLGVSNSPKAQVNIGHLGNHFDNQNVTDLLPHPKRINPRRTFLKAAWLKISGTVAFLGSIASILSYWLYSIFVETTTESLIPIWLF